MTDTQSKNENEPTTDDEFLAELDRRGWRVAHASSAHLAVTARDRAGAPAKYEERDGHYRAEKQLPGPRQGVRSVSASTPEGLLRQAISAEDHAAAIAARSKKEDTNG
jgi:hypothetical protein